MTNYYNNVTNRNSLKFLLGIITRLPKYIKFRFIRLIAILKGARISSTATLNYNFASKCGLKITVHNHVSLDQGVDISTSRFNLEIKPHTIIGHHVTFLMGTHNINSENWENYRPGSDGLVIEEYVWICPKSTILPSVKRIGYGAVIGAGSVVTKDVPPMTIWAGNPARQIGMRKEVHKNVVVESLLGNDLLTYIKCRFSK